MTAAPVHIGWPRLPRSYIAAIDPEVASLRDANRLTDDAVAVYSAAGRPTPERAVELAELIQRAQVEAVVSIGAGTTIDLAKLALYHARNSGSPDVEHIAIPAGPEPYRAIASLATFDSGPAARETLSIDWLRPHRAVVIAELVEQLDRGLIALIAGDALVHAAESLLSTQRSSASMKGALTAIKGCRHEAPVPSPNGVAVFTAAFEAANAFAETKLGLAHALARPLGIAAGTSHDRFNLMLGPAVIGFWANDETGAGRFTVLDAVGINGVSLAALINEYRVQAGLPPSVPGLGIRKEDALAALDWAPQSSGIPFLPRPVTRPELVSILDAVWADESLAVDRGRGK